MCGRYSLQWDTDELARHFAVVVSMPRIEPRYNIAPTQPVLILHDDGDRRRRLARYVRWGLVPFWAKDPSIGGRMINARCEGIEGKPAFRAAMKYRRCIVPAAGFYEWARTDAGGKQPYYFRYEEARPLAFAGLYEHWQDENGNELDTCTIITTEANCLLAKVHHRMPVLLQPESYDPWLNVATQDAGAVTDLLGPAPAETMIGYPVSRRVNSPANDDAALIEREGEQKELF